ncbi:MAG: TolC family protein [Candidatus Aminicenantes bacterium]|nr:TolC family protein [Candidatus Aminicenantes bacterium]
MKTTVRISIFLITTGALLYSQNPDVKTREMTLQDCVLQALKKNLDIIVLSYNPEISEESVREAKGKFYPQLTFQYQNEDRNQLGAWGVEGTNYTVKGSQFYMAFNQYIPTGGEISLDFFNSTTDSTQALLSLNPHYYSYLRFNIKQPLFKDFGPKIARWQIKKAENQRQISSLDLKATVSQKIFEVDQAYWNLVYAMESLKVNEISLNNSRLQLEKTQKAYKMGLKSAVDLISAETEVANWENSVLSSRYQVDAYELALKKLLNFPTEGPESDIRIFPSEKPEIKKATLSEREALDTALSHRPEMGRIQTEINSSQLDIGYYKNQVKPQLDVNFFLSYPGQSGIRYQYLNDNPFTGIIVDTIEGSRADSIKDIINLKYPNWQIRFDLSLPLQNIFSRAELARAKLQHEQNKAEREKTETMIRFEIKEIFKELRHNEQRIESSTEYRKLMEKKLEAETQKFNLGLVGSEWLFSYQRELASARANEIKALIDYKISLAKLGKILGINVEDKNLDFVF